MDSFQLTILVSLGIYFIFMIAIGLIASRKEDHQEFVIGNRNVGYIPTIGSLATSFRDGSGFVFWIGAGAATGYGGLWVFIGVTCAFILFSFFGQKVRNTAENKGFITIGEMIRHELGPFTEKTGAAIILIVALLAIAMQLYVSGNLISKIAGIPSWAGVTSVASVVGLYLFFGGFGSVVKTDAIQFFIIIALSLIVFIIPPEKEVLMDFESLFSIGAHMGIAFFFFGFGLALASADAWQRLFAARNKNVIKYSFPLAGMFLALMTITLVFIGLSAQSLLTDVAAGDVYFAMFENQIFPVPILAFIAVATMSVTMSTLDTYAYLFASSLAKNFLPEKASATRDKYIRFSRIVFIVLMISMSALALMISDIIEYLFAVISLFVILAPVHLFTGLGLFKKSKNLDILISLILLISAVTYIVMFSMGFMDDFLVMLVPAGLCSVLCTISVLGNKLCQKQIAA